MTFRIFALSGLAILLSLSTVQAQAPKGAKKKGPGAGNNPIPGMPMMPEINWTNGPTEGHLGSIATIKVPQGYKFIGQDQTRAFAKLTGNLPDPSDQGVITSVAPEGWFLVFAWAGVGYVKDDEKTALDADPILEQLRSGQVQGNEQRRAQGLDTLTILGWAKPPFFDDQTKLLTWGTRIKSDNSDVISINYNSKILGRSGYMSAELVAGEQDLDKAVEDTRKLVQGFTFVQGQRYAEFRAGDHIAEYGLTTLIAGAGVGLAAKAGLLGKLGKGLIAIVVVVCGAVGSFFKRIFGGGSKE